MSIVNAGRNTSVLYVPISRYPRLRGSDDGVPAEEGVPIPVAPAGEPPWPHADARTAAAADRVTSIRARRMTGGYAGFTGLSSRHSRDSCLLPGTDRGLLRIIREEHAAVR